MIIGLRRRSRMAVSLAMVHQTMFPGGVNGLGSPNSEDRQSLLQITVGADVQPW